MHEGSGLHGQTCDEGGRRSVVDRLWLDPSSGTLRGHREVRRKGEFLKAHQLRSGIGSHPHTVSQGRPVLLRVCMPTLLDGTDPKQPRLPVANPGQRDLRRRRKEIHCTTRRAGTC